MAIEPTIFIAFASLVISLIIAVFNIWRANTDLTLELIGYNDIMRRIKILEEQILTLYGENNG